MDDWKKLNNIRLKKSWDQNDIDELTLIIGRLLKRNDDLSSELRSFIDKVTNLEERIRWYRNATTPRNI